MKTDVYGLLGMIKDGKVPKKILFKGKYYRYVNKEKDYYLDGFSYDEALFDEYVITDILNDEVEILETTITYKPDKKDKLKATLNCIKDSETILGGEYYVIHSDFIVALEEELDKINEIMEAINE